MIQKSEIAIDLSWLDIDLMFCFFIRQNYEKTMDNLKKKNGHFRKIWLESNTSIGT